MKPQRFFRASEDVYEHVRATLDAAWGLPVDGQISCFAPAPSGVRDSSGMMLLAVDLAFCEYSAVASLLPEMLSSGAVEEIDLATYRNLASA